METEIKKLQGEIKALEAEHYKLHITEADASETLDFHLKRLQKAGATLEDAVCRILRTLIEQDRLQKRIDEKKESLRMLKLRSGNYSGEDWL